MVAVREREIDPPPPLDLPFCNCVKCDCLIVMGEECYALDEVVFCVDCVRDYLRDNKVLAGER